MAELGALDDDISPADVVGRAIVGHHRGWVRRLIRFGNRSFKSKTESCMLQNKFFVSLVSLIFVISFSLSQNFMYQAQAATFNTIFPTTNQKNSFRTYSPNLALLLENGSTNGKLISLNQIYDGSRVNTISNQWINGTVLYEGGGIWYLSITVVKAKIRSVYFPYQMNRRPFVPDNSDKVFYYPYVGGIAWKSTEQRIDKDWAWWGVNYPGILAAPFVILADSDQARINAAVNWPPIGVGVYFAGERMALNYLKPLAPGDTFVVRSLIAEIKTDPSTGILPWQFAVDLYAKWLYQNIGRIQYASWINQSHGLIDVQLENIKDFSVSSLKKAISPFLPYFKNLFFWGQMSDYPGECCGEFKTDYANLAFRIHPRYLQPGNDLTAWARELTSTGYKVAYYSSPYHDTFHPGGLLKKLLNSVDGLNWFTGWTSYNRQHNANIFYIDTLGGDYWGPPSTMSALFSNPSLIPYDSVIERSIDFYPRAALMSAQLHVDQNFCGAPGKDAVTDPSQRSGFPQLMRYLLRDRPMFAGVAGKGSLFWSTYHFWNYPFAKSISLQCKYYTYCNLNPALCENGTERLVFLLGQKFDAPLYASPFMEKVIQLREKHLWWQRNPTYLSTVGLNLSGIGSNDHIEVSRFVDRQCKNLLVVANPLEVSGRSVKFQNASIPLSASEIDIIELGPATNDVFCSVR